MHRTLNIIDKTWHATSYQLCIAAIVGIALTGCKKKDDKPESKTPVITITVQPAATTNLTAGSITGGVSVVTNVTSGNHQLSVVQQYKPEQHQRNGNYRRHNGRI